MIVPGLIAVIMSIIAAMLTALTIAREWERGTMEQLAATPVGRARGHPRASWCPYLAIGLFDVAITVVAGMTIFGTPFHGSVLLARGDDVPLPGGRPGSGHLHLRGREVAGAGHAGRPWCPRTSPPSSCRASSSTSRRCRASSRASPSWSPRATSSPSRAAIFLKGVGRVGAVAAGAAHARSTRRWGWAWRPASSRRSSAHERPSQRSPAPHPPDGASRRSARLLRDPMSLRMIFGAPIIHAPPLRLRGEHRRAQRGHLPGGPRPDRWSRAGSVDAFTASGYFHVVGTSDRPADLGRALDDGDARVGLEIPPGFAADVKAGRGPAVQLIVDGTNSNTATVAGGLRGQDRPGDGRAHRRAGRERRSRRRWTSGPGPGSTPPSSRRSTTSRRSSA